MDSNIGPEELERLKEIEKKQKERYKQQNKHTNAIYDRLNFTVPKGYKKKIEDAARSHNLTVNKFISQVLLSILFNNDLLNAIINNTLQDWGALEIPEENPEEKQIDFLEKSKDSSPMEHTPLDLAELQSRLDAKKAEQDRKAEELEQARKGEKEQGGKELVDRIRQLREKSKKTGESTEFKDFSDVEITRIFQNPELMEALKDPEGKEEFIKKFGINNYEKVREYINNIARCRDEI